MTILQAGKNLSAELNRIYDYREAANITSMVLEKITGFTITERLVNKQFILNTIQENELQNFTEQLLQHKPVQYVLNEAWFAGMNFYVDENVLIPRPETEELVETVIEDAISDQQVSLLDIGTGSGCIAIALKKKLPSAKVYALDISIQALDVARKNATINEADIQFFCTDILNIYSESNFPTFDIIVSNPPYIKKAEAREMFQNVLMYEPHLALFVPDEDALIFYKAIADFSLKFLKPANGKLYLEINEMMAEQVASLLKEKRFSQIKIKKDLHGKERIVCAVLK